MRHAIILAHPDPMAFNAAAARAWAGAVEEMSHEADLRDLYRLGFDPRLPAEELPWNPNFAVAPAVIEERSALEAAQSIVFVYPLWFNAPPAMLKGYVERVLGAHFGFETAAPGTRPLLGGKTLVTISTSGAPSHWVVQTGALERLQTGFDQYLASVCGLTVLDHLNLGGVTPGIRPDAAEDMLNQVRLLARLLFAAGGRRRTSGVAAS